MSLIGAARHLYETCPLCKSPNTRQVGRADCSSHALYNTQLPSIINWHRCDACGHIFTDGYFTNEALEIIFSEVHENQLPNTDNLERDRAFAADMIDKVSSCLGNQEGKWLDVGFGSGALMTTCSEYGFEAIGLDLRRMPVERMKKFGYEAHCTDLIDFHSHDFRVISMADVLEHMPFPKKSLSHAYELLLPGGVLFVSCPNADSFLWAILSQNKMNPYWMELEHYHNFGRKRLYSLLREHGFEPVNYSVSQRYRIGMEIIAVKPM